MNIFPVLISFTFPHFTRAAVDFLSVVWLDSSSSFLSFSSLQQSSSWRKLWVLRSTNWPTLMVKNLSLTEGLWTPRHMKWNPITWKWKWSRMFTCCHVYRCSPAEQPDSRRRLPGQSWSTQRWHTPAFPNWYNTRRQTLTLLFGQWKTPIWAWPRTSLILNWQQLHKSTKSQWPKEVKRHVGSMKHQQN